MSIYDKEAGNIYADLNPTVPSQQMLKPQSYKLAKKTRLRPIFYTNVLKKKKMLKK